MSTATPSGNTVIKGYELRAEIGKGGFGAVYRAYQPAVGRDVAIKIILPQFANQPDFIRSFESEAQLVARLEHPFIVPLFDYWRDPDGAYLVMRFLKGGSLYDLIAEGGMPLDQVMSILEQVASALTSAHRHGVIHRDIKPANILLDEEGNAYLADFGIAKVVGEGEDDDTLAGSPAYIPPEQVLGETVTPQADIYSLGVVLFEMLSGRQPFSADTAAQLLYMHLQDPLPDIEELRDDLPRGVNDIIQRATAKTPEQRYQDALALAADLRRCLAEKVSPDTQITVTVADIVNPYKGLRAFEEADAADFFGRDALIQRLLERMQEDDPQAHFLAVVGPSGSGKSSVVKAGLLPALRQGRLPRSAGWFFAEMSPGHHPMRELESALLSVATAPIPNLTQTLDDSPEGLARAIHSIVPQGQELLLIIDQFEEVFTQVHQEQERAHFLNSLQSAMNDPTCPLRVIVTLRADFYDRPLMYEGFADLMRRRTEVVVPLTTSELEEAIVAPVRRLGLDVEPELLATIIADISQEPGTLPLLQYALTEVFERRQGNTLTLAAYQASGGALGALARRAQELYDDMDSDRQALIRQLFLRLVNVGEGTEDTRRRLSWEELTSFAGDGPDLQHVLEVFGKYRLLSFDRDPITRAPTVEIAHEALIREWAQLRQWLATSREAVRMQRRLSNAAALWREANRNPDYLLSGAQLEEMESWAATTDLALTDEERGYLAASIVARRAQLAREAARRRRRQAQERRARIRLQILVGVLAIVAGLTLGLSAFTLIRADQAEARAATATAALGQAQERLATLQAAVHIEDNRAADTYRSLLIASYARQAQAQGDDALALSLTLAAAQIEAAPPLVWEQLAHLLELPATSDRDALLAAAQAATRPLTCEERTRYHVLPEC